MRKVKMLSTPSTGAKLMDALFEWNMLVEVLVMQRLQENIWDQKVAVLASVKDHMIDEVEVEVIADLDMMTIMLALLEEEEEVVAENADLLPHTEADHVQEKETLMIEDGVVLDTMKDHQAEVLLRQVIAGVVLQKEEVVPEIEVDLLDPPMVVMTAEEIVDKWNSQSITN